jgi:hypothetical protein
MRDYIDTLRRRVPPIHPCGQMAVHAWLDQAVAADETGDTREVARLLALIRWRIVQELRPVHEHFPSPHA